MISNSVIQVDEKIADVSLSGAKDFKSTLEKLNTISKPLNNLRTQNGIKKFFGKAKNIESLVDCVSILSNSQRESLDLLILVLAAGVSGKTRLDHFQDVINQFEMINVIEDQTFISDQIINLKKVIIGERERVNKLLLMEEDLMTKDKKIKQIIDRTYLLEEETATLRQNFGRTTRRLLLICGLSLVITSAAFLMVILGV